MRRALGAVSLLAAIGVWQAAGASAVTISYPNFASASGLTMNGAAINTGGVLRLVPGVSEEIGSAFTNRRVVSPKRSFKTRFRFSIHDGSATPGEGMTFVLHRSGAEALGVPPGGGLGYIGIEPSLAVEFDLFENLGEGDPNGNHVAILRDGDTETHLATATPEFDLENGTRWAWIEYSAARKRTKIYLSDTGSKPGRPLLSFKRKLSRVLGGGKLRVGFTAASGAEYAVMDVQTWTLKQRRRRR